MIGRHPAAFGLPELNLFVSDTLEGLWSEMAESRQVQIHGLLRAVAYLFAGEQTMAAIAMARRWLTQRMHWPTSRVFNEIRATVAPFRIVEKSRVNVRDADCLERIRETCPDAYFVHLVRHPMAFGTAVLAEGDKSRRAVQEMLETASEGLILDPQLLWLGVERRIASFLEGIPARRQIRLRIEQLFEAPQARLTGLARALRLSTDQAAIDAMLHPERSPFAGLGPVGANLGDEPQFLRNPTFPVRVLQRTTLEGPLPWRRDRAGFRDDVVKRARSLGYV